METKESKMKNEFEQLTESLIEINIFICSTEFKKIDPISQSLALQQQNLTSQLRNVIDLQMKKMGII